MPEKWMSVGEWVWENRWLRFVYLTMYYLAIVVGLIWLYGKGDFATPPFIYQGF
jgi:hypothetical protein